MTSSVAVSTFNNVSDPNVVSTTTGEWSAFAAGLRTPLSKDIAKDDLPLWSLAEFREGHRHADNVHSITALTLDVDESPIPDAHALVHALSGLTSVCYSSSSATQRVPRWRATIQLSRPVTAEEYSKLSVAFAECFLWFPVGCASKDPARQWYWPREGSDGHYEWISIIGEPLDVDTVLSLTPEDAPKGPTVANVREACTSTTARRSAAAAMLASAWPPKGARLDARLALSGATHYAGMSEAEAVQFMEDVHARVTDRGDVTTSKLATLASETFRKAERGDPVAGFPALSRYVDASVVNAARDLLNEGVQLMAEIARELNATSSQAANDTTTVRLTPAQRALRVGGRDIVRLSTGLPTLDGATRGGLLLRKVVGVGGAPGAGKTALAVQMAHGWATAGIHVAFLAADEDADAILIRFGQLAGLSRDALENGDADTRAKLAAWCESVPLMLVDGDDAGSTVEEVSKELVEGAKGKPSALVVDSLQTVRTKELPPKGADLRAKVNIVVRTLKHAAKVDGHLVVTTSEIARSAYRNKDQAENANPLAAFKESGDIEYGMGLAFVLTSRQGSSDLVDATVVKNRLGQGKPAFLLRLDHTRAGVAEANASTIETADPLFLIKQEIKDALEAHCGSPISKTTIYEKIGGRKAAVLKAVAELLDAKVLIEDRRGGLRFPLPGDAGYPR